MATRKRLLSLKAAVVFFAAVGVAVFAVNEWRLPRPFDGRLSLPRVECDRLAPNYSVETVSELPEQVSSLICDHRTPPTLLVGTRGKAGVFRAVPRSPYGVIPIALSTGAEPGFGTAQVSVLALAEVQRDQPQQLVALVAQENPRGKPRAYLMSTHPTLPSAQTEMTTIDIASSWPHGIAFVKDVFGRPTFLSTFCGFGEVVEFRPFDRKTPAGFRSHGLESRPLGMLSASGEQLAGAELFGSNPYVLVARGFKFNHAAIEIYSRDHSTPFSQAKIGALGLGWARRWELREGDRFGNVRFLVGALRDGVRDIYAWWCVGLADGDTEFVHYRLGLTGVVERRAIGLGPAAEYWPEENQIALVDADADGVDELYFTSRAGNLWRMDVASPESAGEPAASLTPSLVAHFPGGAGPIVASTCPEGGVIPLYVAIGNFIVKATPKKAPPAAKAVAQVKLAEPAAATSSR